VRPTEHVYNGTYPSIQWKTLANGLNQAAVEKLVGPTDHWLNKAFKLLPGDVTDFLKKRRSDVRAVYYHDGTWRMISSGDIDEIISAVEIAQIAYETQAAYLKRDVVALRELK
jgi:hypothetical protein